MIKSEQTFGNYKITQIQLGFFSIDMEAYYGDLSSKNHRTLLASNIYVVEVLADQSIWILDTGFSAHLDIPYISPRMKYSFGDVLKTYANYSDINIILTHCHPDHIGGLMAEFEQIKGKNTRVFLNRRDLVPSFYTDYPEIEAFLTKSLQSYSWLFDIQFMQHFKVECLGGHTPEHTVLRLAEGAIYYPADLVPTLYHVSHLPMGERNFDQDKFEQNRSSFLKAVKATNGTLLLAHAPNNGIIRI
jgi:glyoxylase-like metal-dependent hydrolase (beta-lactamase superfamily II)